MVMHEQQPAVESKEMYGRGNNKVCYKPGVRDCWACNSKPISAQQVQPIWLNHLVCAQPPFSRFRASCLKCLRRCKSQQRCTHQECPAN